MAENQEPDEKDKPEPLRSKQALAKALKGPEVWNEWAKENPDQEVTFQGVDFTTGVNKKISFKDFTFPGNTDFSRTQFRGADFGGANFGECTWFTEAIFEDDARFDKATFGKYARFESATFRKGAWFPETTFEGDAGFGGATFSGLVALYGSRFQFVPDFRRTDFQKHITLHGMEVNFLWPALDGDADKYRRLKELAVNARNHDLEQMFFAYELMAKRGHETRGLKLIPNYLYGWFSGFGRSLRRPCAWLLGVWFGFGILYNWIATKEMSHLWDGLLFSVAHLFPFLGASKGALAEAKTALFGNAPLGVLVNFSAMLEGGLGILFLFLIGLALRNRFRL